MIRILSYLKWYPLRKYREESLQQLYMYTVWDQLLSCRTKLLLLQAWKHLKLLVIEESVYGVDSKDLCYWEEEKSCLQIY